MIAEIEISEVFCEEVRDEFPPEVRKHYSGLFDKDTGEVILPFFVDTPRKRAAILQSALYLEQEEKRRLTVDEIMENRPERLRGFLELMLYWGS
jgi:hypothetical protein